MKKQLSLNKLGDSCVFTLNNAERLYYLFTAHHSFFKKKKNSGVIDVEHDYCCCIMLLLFCLLNPCMTVCKSASMSYIDVCLTFVAQCFCLTFLPGGGGELASPLLGALSTVSVGSGFNHFGWIKE